MRSFQYSKHFEDLINAFNQEHMGLPNYEQYLKDHLGGPDSRLVRFTNYMCPEIEYHCGKLRSKRVLDFGCGTGATTAALMQFCDEVVAFDKDQESIDICKQRIREHGFKNSPAFYSADDIDKVKDELGTFDLILANDVIEHIPLTRPGLRKKIIKTLFHLLKPQGRLFINSSPNRLYPFDFHTTQLWWLPWSSPGSQWAYTRARRKGRHTVFRRISEGSLGLEECGTWGITYWEIMNYLGEEGCVCLNTIKGHDRHIFYTSHGSWKRSVFEFLIYRLGVKLLDAPITAFTPFINNLVIEKQ